MAAGAALANAGIFVVVAKEHLAAGPSTRQYILDWILFALVSLLPLGVALLLLRLVPQAATPIVTRAGTRIELHAERLL